MSDRGLGPDFRWFWAARMVAVVGSSLTAVALPVIAYGLTRSASLTAAVTALQVAPYLVFGLMAGAMADRLPRRSVMLGAQAVSSVALLSVPAAQQAGSLHVAHVLAVAGLVSSAFVFFDAAAFGALPAIVGRTDIARANSALWTASTLVGVGAPALGGVLVAAVGADNVLAIDAACYVAAGACMLAVARPMGPLRTADDRHRPTVRSDIAEGIEFLWRHDVIRPLTVLGVANSVTAGGVTGLLLVLAVEQLGVSSDGPAFGGLLAVIALGGFLAAAALPALSRHVPIGWITLGGLTMGIPAVLLLAASSSVAASGACLLIWSTGSTAVILNGISLRQQLTPDRLQARVNTTGRMVAWGGTPVGALACGGLAQVSSVGVAIAATSAVLLVGISYGWSAGLWRRDFSSMPQPDGAGPDGAGPGGAGPGGAR